MFDDIGGKIKTLAKITCGLGIAASIIGDCAWMQNSNYNPTTIIGVCAGVGFAGFMDRFIFHLWIWSVD
ncbi:MAG: hypothetical protein ACLUI3_11915 [Christensenellales bacterium]